MSVGAWVTLIDGAEQEVSPEFLQMMADRMATSFFKYGALRDAYPHKVDALASLQMRLDKYRETGNREWLVDVANFAMIEFIAPRHADAHFTPTDSAESPGRMVEGRQTADPNTRGHFRKLRDHYKYDGD